MLQNPAFHANNNLVLYYRVYILFKSGFFHYILLFSSYRINILERMYIFLLPFPLHLSLQMFAFFSFRDFFKFIFYLPSIN